ncbi:hypothetical protein GTA08_BOTSDO00891 [Neofusicoccum parvum]|nr:hypothetical protein GTA08_BOTSDO00891 [Neofusicoccum parvum]
MSNFAPPISRDGFVYHGQLYVDAGNLNRHPRASEAELTALLRPKKSAKAAPQKDQVGHWYVAQLNHYGLPQTKDKNAAKVRLLDALNAGRLKVPPAVKKLEAALKKEYDAANRKAKAELKAKTPAVEAATATPAKKRKRNGEDDVAAAPASTTSKKARAPAKDPEPAKKKTAKASDRPIAPGRAGKTGAAPKTKKALHDSKKGYAAHAI